VAGALPVAGDAAVRAAELSREPREPRSSGSRITEPEGADARGSGWDP
jgi:hypothetical protein